ncbi:hypothetical protein CRG98_050221, partial [Punica granatum]
RNKLQHQQSRSRERGRQQRRQNLTGKGSFKESRSRRVGDERQSTERSYRGLQSRFRVLTNRLTEPIRWRVQRRISPGESETRATERRAMERSCGCSHRKSEAIPVFSTSPDSCFKVQTMRMSEINYTFFYFSNYLRFRIPVPVPVLSTL